MHTMTRTLLLTALAGTASLGLLGGCEKPADDAHHGHSHDDGHTHDDGHDHGEGGLDDHGDHGEEVSLGTAEVGGMELSFAQGHGEIEAGKEMHLVIKLPYTDKGATQVRAWIGGEDPMGSLVSKAEYAASHDDYDVHCVAPDPLGDDAMWWIELEQPNGVRTIVSVKPQ